MTDHDTRLASVLLDARFSKRMRGGDRCRFELANHLLRDAAFLAKYDLHIFGYEYAKEFVDLDPATTFLLAPYQPSQHPQFDLFEHWHLPNFGQALGIKLYHSTYNILPLRRVAPIQVLTVLDMAVFDFPEGYSKKFGAYMRWLLTAGIKKADSLICISEATRQQMLKRFPEAAEKSIVIPVGVGDEFVTIGNRRLEESFPEGHPLAGGQPYVLYVGNLEPKKNLPRLIDGFLKAKADAKFPHRLVIVGEQLPKGPDAGLSASVLEDLKDQVVFLGYQTDSVLMELYQSASLVAYPSLYEGFGMPVLEGVAAGVPTLTSNVSSLPEAGGGIAWMIDPMSTEAIASGLIHCLTDQSWRSDVKARGVSFGASMRWASIAQTTRNLYEKLLSQ